MTGVEWVLKLGKKEYYMDSCVEHFILLLKAAFQQAAGIAAMESASVHDTGNTLRTCGAYYQAGNLYNWMFNTQPGAGVDTYGILVGSNNTAVDITDYKLNTQISHGVAAGNLQYGAQTTAYGGVDPNKWAKILRTFTNGSGNDVVVKEVGLVCRPNVGGIAYNILITRDIIADPGITIVNADSLPVEIHIRTTA